MVVFGAFIRFKVLGPTRGASAGRNINNLYSAVSMALQAPFFLAFPAVLLLLVRPLRQRIALLRAVVLCWWVCAGSFLAIAPPITSRGFSTFQNNPSAVVLDFLSLFASPISTCFAGVTSRSPFSNYSWVFRGILGLFGLAVMLVALKLLPVRGEVAAAAETLEKSPVPESETAGEPGVITKIPAGEGAAN